eukprot:COSAG02_NODE_49022_length_329_cov_15.386957_1_plen_25_part_01
MLVVIVVLRAALPYSASRSLILFVA